MKWVKRGVWVAAWGVWAWCGVGLYRELPRDLGTEVCRLPISKGESFVGLLDTPAAVTAAKSDDDRLTIRLWDLVSGTMTKSFTGPYWFADWFSELLDSRGWLSPEHRLLLSNAPWDRPVRPPNFYSVLNLESGQWRRLNVPDNASATLHHTRPWALFLEEAKTWVGFEATVMDLRTGERLFRWPSPSSPRNGLRLQTAFFVGDGVALSFREPDEKDPRPEQFVEWWLLLPEPSVSSRQSIEIRRDPNSTSSTGRAVWRDYLHFDECWVYDLATGRSVFDSRKPHPEEKGSVMFSLSDTGPPLPNLLSADGRLLFDGSVRDLDAGRVVWSPQNEVYEGKGRTRVGSSWYLRKGEKVTAADPRGWFETTETWQLRLGNWSREATTYGIRSARTAALAFRCHNPIASSTVWSSRAPRVSSDRNWMVNENGQVFRLPPRPNYPLLLLCQSILALPLTLLWAGLRWRRKRGKRRLAGATA